MKVRCTNNTLCDNLTIGKEYSVVEEGDKYYVIVDNLQDEITTKKERFVVVEDGDLAKKAKATITELGYQVDNSFKDISDFKIRKNSKGEIKEILVKFKYE